MAFAKPACSAHDCHARVGFSICNLSMPNRLLAKQQIACQGTEFNNTTLERNPALASIGAGRVGFEPAWE